MIESRRGVQRLARLGAQRRNAITQAEIDRALRNYQEMHDLVFGGFKEGLPKRYPEKKLTLREKVGKYSRRIQEWANR